MDRIRKEIATGLISLILSNPESFAKERSETDKDTDCYQQATQVDLGRDYKSGALVENATPNNLPHNVLGMYYGNNHSIKLTHPAYMDTRYRHFVEEHESAHARGVYDEIKADAIAASETGYVLRPELVLGPIKRIS